MNTQSCSITAVLTMTVAGSLAFGADPSAGQHELIRKLSGAWKQNQAKSKIGSGLSLRFRTNAAGQLEELRGPEARPVIHPVDFSKPYNNRGLTIVWKQTGPNTYERTLSANGRVVTTRRIRLSTDGRTLREEFGRKGANGKTVTRTSEFRRDSGDAKGLAGTWKVVSIRDSEPPVVEYTPAGKNALKASTPLGQTYVLTFDGKPAPITGTAVIPDMTITARAIDGNTLETTTTREGVPVSKARIQLSEGGKVMTVTSTNLGPNAGEPSVTLFDKQ